MTGSFSIESHLGPNDIADALAHDVRSGLTDTPKHLPPKWFYDEVGSELFDKIIDGDLPVASEKEAPVLLVKSQQAPIRSEHHRTRVRAICIAGVKLHTGPVELSQR